MEERRKFPRLAIDVDVSWRKVEGEDADDLDKDMMRDISEGGICLMVYEPVQTGDKVSLEFQLPNAKKIKALGRVAWVDSFEVVSKRESSRCDVGIEFVEIKSQDREEIKKFVFAFLK